MASQAQERTKVFISYSHADRKWLERLNVHLKPLGLKNEVNAVEVWADDQIEPGMKWRDEIGRALGEARVAVLLVSPDFLASDFINEVELPALLDSARDGGTEILIVILGAVLPAAEGVPLPPVLESLLRFQTVNNPKSPLKRLDEVGQDEVWVTLRYRVQAAFMRRQNQPQASAPSRPASSQAASAARAAEGDCRDYASVFEIHIESARKTVLLFYAAVVAATLVGLALILSVCLIPDFRQNMPVFASMLAFGAAACGLPLFFMKKVVDEYAGIKSCEFMKRRFDSCEKWEAGELRENIRVATEFLNRRMLKS